MEARFSTSVKPFTAKFTECQKTAYKLQIQQAKQKKMTRRLSSDALVQPRKLTGDNDE
jgi:hypothetical protein